MVVIFALAMKKGVTHYKTADGSSTLCSERFGAHYHSMNGAVTESEHVFIKHGLGEATQPEISLLEVGFGTGLNAALTAIESLKRGINISYYALELYPLSDDDYKLLNYSEELSHEAANLWRMICEAQWNKEVRINSNFTICKLNTDFTTWQPPQNFHLVYFDAFAPDDQPEMWSREQFQKIFNSLHAHGIMVTYCVKGIVKQTLLDIGFEIERLAGPPGKKHMLRAKKTI